MDFQQGRAWSCLCFRHTSLDATGRVDRRVRQEPGRAEIRLVRGPEQERSRLNHGCAEEGAGNEGFR